MTDTLSPGGLGISVVTDGTTIVSATRELVFTSGATVADGGKGSGKVNVAISTVGTPASSSAAGVAGQVMMDASYAYFCVATNTWLRVAIATW